MECIWLHERIASKRSITTLSSINYFVIYWFDNQCTQLSMRVAMYYSDRTSSLYIHRRHDSKSSGKTHYFPTHKNSIICPCNSSVLCMSELVPNVYCSRKIVSRSWMSGYFNVANFFRIESIFVFRNLRTYLKFGSSFRCCRISDFLSCSLLNIDSSRMFCSVRSQHTQLN